MNESKPVGQDGPTPFPEQLKEPLRGGVIMLLGSLFWGSVSWYTGPIFSGGLLFSLLFGWLPSTWFVFAAGTILGCLFPCWGRQCSFGSAIFRGLALGVIAGLAVGVIVWITFNQNGLCGLLTNYYGPGYLGYRAAVQKELWHSAMRILMVVVPVTGAWVAVWGIWINRFSKPTSMPSVSDVQSHGIILRFDRHLFRVLGWLVAGFSGLGALVCLCVMLGGKDVAGSILAFLLSGLGTAVLMLVGPLMGPLVNPGGGHVVAFRLFLVAFPVLLAGIAPFALVRRPVKPKVAILAWCGLITAILFWTGMGALSLGYSLG